MLVTREESHVGGGDGERVAFRPQDERAQRGPIGAQHEEGVVELPAGRQRPPQGSEVPGPGLRGEALETGRPDKRQRGRLRLPIELDPEVGVGEAAVKLLALQRSELDSFTSGGTGGTPAGLQGPLPDHLGETVG